MDLLRVLFHPATEGTFQVKVTGLRPKIVVAADGRGVVGHVGARLLADLADATGPPRALTKRRLPGYVPRSQSRLMVGVPSGMPAPASWLTLPMPLSHS